MNKRGQMYLLGAIVIIALLIGFTAVYNFTKNNKLTRTSELKEELKVESSKVLQYVENTGDSEMLENFTQTFSEYAGNNFEIYYITEGGECDCIVAYTYNELGAYIEVPHDEIEGKVSIEVNGIDYEFNLDESENFYFVIRQSTEGEEYVETNA